MKMGSRCIPSSFITIAVFILSGLWILIHQGANNFVSSRRLEMVEQSSFLNSTRLLSISTTRNYSSVLSTKCECNRLQSDSDESLKSKGQTRKRTYSTRSTCSQEADQRGPGQHVVAYTLFGEPDLQPNSSSITEEIWKRYFTALHQRAVRVAQAYPGWIMRIYHNLTDTNFYESILCPLRCQHAHVDLCDVQEINSENTGGSDGEIERLNPRMWRFLVMLDPLVDYFLSRDLDSDIVPREIAAVRQWLDSSNYTFHIMRDHPSHGGFMLAGLWGAKNVKRRDLLRRLGMVLLWSGKDDRGYQTDQNRLDLIVWPFATFDVMAHDAYFCNDLVIRLGQMVPPFPFPTPREGRNYTGYDLIRTDIADAIKPCPFDCRPPKHKNWLYC